VRSRLTSPAIKVSSAAMPSPTRGARSIDVVVKSKVMITAPIVCPVSRAVPCMPPAAPLRARGVDRNILRLLDT
jgi:hypothetical protein